MSTLHHLVPSSVRVPQLHSSACAALLYYDYFLTVSDEIQFFWVQKSSKIAKFFLFIRYICLLRNIPVAIEVYSRWSQEVSLIDLCVNLSF